MPAHVRVAPEDLGISAVTVDVHADTVKARHDRHQDRGRRHSARGHEPLVEELPAAQSTSLSIGTQAPE